MQTIPLLLHTLTIINTFTINILLTKGSHTIIGFIDEDMILRNIIKEPILSPIKCEASGNGIEPCIYYYYYYFIYI